MQFYIGSILLFQVRVQRNALLASWSYLPLRSPFQRSLDPLFSVDGLAEAPCSSLSNHPIKVRPFRSISPFSHMGISVFLKALIFLSVLLGSSLADPRATLVAMKCTNRTVVGSDRGPFVANLVASLDSLTTQLSSKGYGSVTKGAGNSSVYAFGECMKDLSQSDCNLCFAQCKIQILRCFPFQLGIRGGRVFFDGCYLRYDDYNFFNDSLSPVDSTVCATEKFSGNNTAFDDHVTKLGKTLSLGAPKNDSFLVGSVTGGNTSVFGLAQCWKYTNDCESCLNNSFSRIVSCPPSREGRVINAGCYMRYSTEKFYYNNTATATTGGNSDRRLAIILGSTFSGVALLLIILTMGITMRKRALKRRKEMKLLGHLAKNVNKSKLNFSYEALEKATNYFHSSNKLGQGGSGSVYKGILPDGKPVAIKRLVFNTRQWVEHFFNEVNLISDIRHKNLVRLLGCSITGPESLLVYEYIPNLSLLDHLFVRAMPLLTHFIHGRGYMAPEYVVRGKLTEKADVYSYGVAMAEVITGKRNNSFCGNSFSILQMVWDLYANGRLCEAVDPNLQGRFPEVEASRILQIALLCVQASGELRPQMSMVVRMLSDDCEIPSPTQPPFISSGHSGSASERTKSSINSLQIETDSRSSGTTMTDSFSVPR
ncbi:hypothetical protein SAY86_008677 [Trapa natans]|uniref:Cysteine-rich receptor-like protein kinase 3 n=1 Tax=Trapa natans TaxID=22666 RepID=A0AAN7K9T1_TRANT|nr:hypothetical protein SAY86_008677 [Trapa natans]